MAVRNRSSSSGPYCPSPTAKPDRARRALLVGAHVRGRPYDDLTELAELARTAGACVVDGIIQRLPRFDPATFIGKGKVEEIAERVKAEDIGIVIFNDMLSPTQIRNLQERLTAEVKVLDRAGLILDIFAMHARSRDSKLRVELAQLEYLLPRLAGLWQHLERQQGGLGTRGPGETQIEVDRRRAKEKISKLREQLRSVAGSREVQRVGREGVGRVSIIGYTNAGKSTLLTALSGQPTLAEDKLFATLDTKTTRLVFPDSVGGPPRRVLLTDTVGFIRNLPDHLFDAFLSTLAELREADMLLHVVDVSNPGFRGQVQVVMDVLKRLQIASPRIVTVFNKTDKLDKRPDFLLDDFPRAFFVSASKGDGIGDLRAFIGECLKSEASWQKN